MRSYLAKPTPLNAYIFLTLTMLFWAGNYTVGRWASGHVPPVTLAFLRWTGATLLILPFAWHHVQNDWPIIRKHLAVVVLLGVTGSGLFNTLQYIALTKTTATNAGIINSSAPIMIVILSAVVNRETIYARQTVGITISLAGVMCVLSKGNLNALADVTFNIGDLVMLGAMAIWALYTSLLKSRPAMSIFSFALVIYAVAAVLNAGLAALELASGAHVTWSLSSSGAILYTAVFPSFLAYLLFNRGVEILGPSVASPFMHLVPLFTVVLAIVFLGEAPQLFHGIGLCLILLGVWLAVAPRNT